MHFSRKTAWGVWSPFALCSLTVLTAAAVAVPAHAQRPASVSASVSQSAVGAPAPTATPIGGLRTAPLSRSTSARAIARESRTLGRGVTVPFYVEDAPMVYGVVAGTEQAARPEPTQWPWVPTGDAPTWVRDTSVSEVYAWRDLIVSDVVCNQTGTCMDRRQRVRARWLPACGCYAFADGWNRIWRVE